MKALSYLAMKAIPVVIAQDDLTMKTTIYIGNKLFNLSSMDINYARDYANALVQKQYGIYNSIRSNSG